MVCVCCYILWHPHWGIESLVANWKSIESVDAFLSRRRCCHRKRERERESTTKGKKSKEIAAWLVSTSNHHMQRNALGGNCEWATRWDPVPFFFPSFFFFFFFFFLRLNLTWGSSSSFFFFFFLGIQLSVLISGFRLFAIGSLKYTK